MTRKSLPERKLPPELESRDLSIDLTKTDLEIKRIDKELAALLQQRSRRLEETFRLTADLESITKDWLRDRFRESYSDLSDEVFEKTLDSMLAIRDKVFQQKELERLKKQKQSEYKFEHEFRELYSISDMPEGEWFGLDKNGNPASNAKNIALALKRLPLCEIMFDELGNCSIKYSNYPIRLQNAPIFFSYKIRDTFKFIPKREQFVKALNLLRGHSP